jgi:demethylmenaquinone methyltransferase / 2-methoxy-6-polyprenyl-1,4-benzoquinol methylase
MFQRLAPDYDRLNTLLTFGLDRAWRRALVEAAGVGPGHRVLDVGTGTGRSLSEARRAVGASGLAVGIDFTEAMLRRARGRRVLADALRLPFPDRTFDASVSAFALRDVADQQVVLAEMGRVTRPRGRLGILEIDRPAGRLRRAGFEAWFRGAVPRIAAAFGQEESHRFLVRSVAYLPSPASLRSMLAAAGIRDIRRKKLTLGAAQLVWGIKG